MRNNGTQIPSLRPASTLRLWRIRTGSRFDVTTTWPSAASVGARMMATRSASGHARSGRTTSATAKPATIVSGSPIPSSRIGMCSDLRRAARSIRDASEKRTTPSVASAKTSTSSPSAFGSKRPSASTPTTSPAAVKSIAGVTDVPSMRPEMAAKPRRISASVTSCQCTLAASQVSELPEPHLLEPDRAPEPVERAVERVVESRRLPHPGLEMERVDDERPLAPLGLQVRASHDAVAPEKRQDVVAELTLVGALVDLDDVLEAEDPACERTVPEQVVERGDERRRRRASRVEVCTGRHEHLGSSVLDPDTFGAAVGDERIRVGADTSNAAAHAPVLGD